MDSELPATNLRNRKRPKRRSLSDSLSLVGSYTIGWAAPNEQVQYLVVQGDSNRWVGFRDGFMSKWTNLNIVCGLIMGAISTVIFSSVELDRASFGLGVVSLLSSLIAIGFGTGLMYVLGDVDGHTLHKIGTRYPILFVFALSIPQVWAGICITSFFLCIGIFAWNASDKGWTAKAGIIFSAVLTILHLLAFARLFHKQHTVETLIDDDEIDNGGMDHNIHIAQLTRGQFESGTSSDMKSDDTSSPEINKPTRPGDAQYVTQFGGSGAGHFVDSPPRAGRKGRPGPGALGKVKSGPLVESPDPASQEFLINRSQGGSGERSSGRTSGTSPQLPELETVPLGDVVNLFASSGVVVNK